MKISISISIILCIFLLQASAHKHDDHHVHTQDSSSKSHIHHNHDHGHDSHDHQSHEDSPKSSERSHRASFVEETLSKYFPNISQNKVIMMSIAVIIISIPSLPTFLVLLSISKLNPNRRKDGPILNEKYLRWMICLAVGSLTGDVFFGMMEHIMASSGHSHDHHDHDHSHDHDHGHGGHKHEFKLEIFCIIVGIFFFYMVDRIVGGHNHNHDHDAIPSNGHDHKHEHEQKHQEKSEKDAQKNPDVRKRGGEEKKQIEQSEEYNKDPQKKVKKSIDRSAALYLVADFLHNVIDGIGIGVAFNINNTLGVTTTIAIATHELPHEIGDFAILMKKNYSLGAIMLTQLSTATGALFGGLLGIYFGNFAESYLLGFTAGGFLYLALGNMIPELLHSNKKASIFEAAIEAGLGFLGAGLIILSS